MTTKRYDFFVQNQQFMTISYHFVNLQSQQTPKLYEPNTPEKYEQMHQSTTPKNKNKKTQQ